MISWFQDLRYAFRQWRKSPGFKPPYPQQKEPRKIRLSKSNDACEHLCTLT
jgi:hypothetical protein